MSNQPENTNNEPLISAPYTDEQIEAAKADLSKLSAVDFLQMTEYLHQLEENANARHTEAPGIVFTTLYSEKGAQISVTARDITPVLALEQIISAIKYAKDKYELLPYRPSPPAPPAPRAGLATPPSAIRTDTPDTISPEVQANSLTPLPPKLSAPPSSQPPPDPTSQTGVPAQGDTGLEKMEVQSISHMITEGKLIDHLIVKTKGGKWWKWGVKAYKEVIPITFETWSKWPVAKAYGVDTIPEMKFAIIDTVKSKVVSFSAS